MGVESGGLGVGGGELRLLIGDPLPMALDNGRLRFDDNIIRCEFAKPTVEFVRRQLLCDAIKPQDVVSCGFEHGCGRPRHHRKDIGGPGEPLELPVLRKKRHALLARQRGIADRDFHGG